MKVISFVFAVLALLAGIYYAMLSSVIASEITPVHATLLACVCMLFVIALGVWKDVIEKIDSWIKDKMD